MTLYKLFRYIGFLFFMTVFILYFFSNNTIPYLSSFYQKIDDVYYSIPGYFIQEEATNSIVQRNTELLLIDPQNVISNFFEDLSTDYALDSAVGRDFNDLEYLIEEYLRYYEFFEDIVLYYDNTVVYKYNQAPSTNTITFINRRNTGRGEIIIEFIFSTDFLRKQLDQFPHTVYIGYRSQILYLQQSGQRLTMDLLAKYRDQADGTFSLDHQNILYKSTLSEGLKYPLTIFFVQQEHFGLGNILQILFLLLFPLFWIVLAVTDRFVSRILLSVEQNKQHRDFLNNMVSKNGEEEGLDWLDDFVGTENQTKKEVEDENNNVS